MSFFQHPTAIVESAAIGEGTRVWAFAHVLPGARVGKDCNICDHVFVENDVTVGDRVTVKSGVQLWDGVTLEDDVFVGPNATFTNDPFPRSKHHSAPYAPTVVRRGASVGANATILPGIEIGAGAMVGAGAVVTANVPRFAIVVGNPARITGYAGASHETLHPTASSEAAKGGVPTRVRGVTFHQLPRVTDLRGELSFGEANAHIPFEIKRYFLTYGVPTREVRGEHAHHQLHQFLVCVGGSCHVVADDGTTRQEFVLDRPTAGLYLPPMTWCTLYKYSPDAILLVLASDVYRAEDYIRDYQEYLAACSSR